MNFVISILNNVLKLTSLYVCLAERGYLRKNKSDSKKPSVLEKPVIEKDYKHIFIYMITLRPKRAKSQQKKLNRE